MNRLKYSVILFSVSCLLFIPLISSASVITYSGNGIYNGQNMFVVLNVNDQLLDWSTGNPAQQNPNGTYPFTQYYYSVSSWYFLGETAFIDYGPFGQLYMQHPPGGWAGEVYLYQSATNYYNQYHGAYWFYDKAMNYLPDYSILPDIIKFSIIDLETSMGPDYNFQSLNFTLDRYTPSPVPEPSTLLLLGSGLGMVVGFGRKKLRKS